MSTPMQRALRWLMRGLKAFGALLALFVVLRSLAALHMWATPRAYMVGSGGLGRLEESALSAQQERALRDLHNRPFSSRAAVFAAYRHRIGAEAVAQHRSVLEGAISWHPCWPTESTRPVARPPDSRGHPLHDRFRWEPVLAAEAGPPVPTNVAFVPGGGAILLGREGHVAFYDTDWQRTGGFRIPEAWQGRGDQGALGIALDPDFAANRFFYVAHVGADNRAHYVQRFTYGADTDAVLASRVTTIRVPRHPPIDEHGIGAIHFMPDGTLLLMVGAPPSDRNTAQDGRSMQGKLLAIRPGNGPEGGYEPAVGWVRSLLRGMRPPVVAEGLRAPWSSAPWGSRLLIGDVSAGGPRSFEEIHLYEGPGANFGYPHCVNPAWHRDYEAPIVAYAREPVAERLPLPEGDSSGGARSVLVGLVYPQAADADPYGDALDGRLLYSDFFLGNVHAARLRSDDGRVTDDVMINQRPHLTAMRRGPDGHVYATAAFGPQALLRLAGPHGAR